MSRRDKLLADVLSGSRDNAIRFEALCNLLLALGFDERTKGGHHIFTHANVAEIVNLQPRADGTAKPYQVKQVRGTINSYDLSLS